MIEVENLTKYYGMTPALQGISFSVSREEVIGLLGPNAAGKTTAMRILTGFLPATSGSVRIDGFDVMKQPLEVKKRVGYLPENVPLYREMVVDDYLKFVAEVKRVPRRERASHLDRVIAECGLGGVCQRIIGHLSKGYRQRVGLAQALIHDPDVLILDEPTEGLDPTQIIEIRELIKALGKQRTVVLSSHILPEVSQTCERVVIINNGRIEAVDTTVNLQRRHQQTGLIRVVARGRTEKLLALLTGISGVRSAELDPQDHPDHELHRFLLHTEPEPAVRERIAAAVIAGGFGLHEIYSREISLEEIFVKLVTDEKEVN